MTCWSAPADGEALGLVDGDGDGVGVTVGDAEGVTGTSAATRWSGTMTVVWLQPVTFMSAELLAGAGLERDLERSRKAADRLGAVEREGEVRALRLWRWPCRSPGGYCRTP